MIEWVIKIKAFQEQKNFMRSTRLALFFKKCGNIAPLGLLKSRNIKWLGLVCITS